MRHIALVISLISVAVLGFVAGRSTVSRPSDELHRDDGAARLEALLERLERLQDSLAVPAREVNDSHPTRTQSSGVDAPTSSTSESQSATVLATTAGALASLEELRGEIDSLLEMVRTRELQSAHARLRRPVMPWWVAWQPVADVYVTRGNDAALSEVFLMTATELVNKFGAPTRIDNDLWSYDRSEEDLAPGALQLVAVNFSSGLVNGLEVYIR